MNVKRKIVGYASTVHRDAHGDVVCAGAFGQQCGVVPLLLEHDSRTQIGKVYKTCTTNLGLVVSAEVSAQSSEKLRNIFNDPQYGLSVGMVMRKFVMRGKTRYITEAKLVEVSVVKRAANAYCSFGFARER
jgi:HK97 family phage prohead protease